MVCEEFIQNKFFNHSSLTLFGFIIKNIKSTLAAGLQGDGEARKSLVLNSFYSSTC